jgi:hypothetical protein
MRIGGIMFLKLSGKTLALFTLLLAAGCSSMNGANNFFPAAGDNPIKIESDPSGADVYVMGEKVGVTPLKISHNDVFPNIYPKEKVSVYGRVTLKKTGCSDFTRTVNGEISSTGLRAQLDCGDKNPSPTATSGNAPPIRESAEQRLEKIKDLLNKGLITEEEAKRAREHIINDL